MNTVPIGYYVHHHGAGHASRFASISNASDETFVAISELGLSGGVRLPSDVVSGGSDPTAGGSLHWAPVGDVRSVQRSLVFCRWLAQARPCGVVVDVSVEAALLCRLCGVPTIVMRQHGDRTDAAHEMAYRGAAALLAPFPAELEHTSTPEWIREKTSYAGFISNARHADGDESEHPAGGGPVADDVVVLWGAGGGALQHTDLESIVRAAHPGQVWFVGKEPFDLAPLGVRALGWVDDVAHVLRRGPTVVGSAGNNVVADVASCGCPLVVVPQSRPFDEQVRHAESLDRQRLAAVVGARGNPSEWSAALDTARVRRRSLAELASNDGASVAADVIRRKFSI